MPTEKPDTEFLNQFTIEPLTKGNWNKFLQLFGVKGACGNCWCMYYRLSRADFAEGKTDDGNRKAIKELVWNNKPTGLMGIYQGQAIAWCAFAPREDFIKLGKSRVHKRIDDKPVWSIPCLFIDKKFRGIGISVEFLKGVANYAKDKGISLIEAYPTIPTTPRIPDSFAWIGLYKSFERAGFEIVDQTSKNRPMVRYDTERF
jgi:GNAT superfamily N-acetyltransferase